MAEFVLVHRRQLRTIGIRWMKGSDENLGLSRIVIHLYYFELPAIVEQVFAFERRFVRIVDGDFAWQIFKTDADADIGIGALELSIRHIDVVLVEFDTAFPVVKENVQCLQNGRFPCVILPNKRSKVSKISRHSACIASKIADRYGFELHVFLFS